jgi:hypothetical protein
VTPAGQHRELWGLLNELAAEPGQAVTVKPSWLRWNGGLVGKVAQGIYDERQLGDLPILADALEEAGCNDPALLEHCRRPGGHALGCWAVDLLLGKG